MANSTERTEILRLIENGKISTSEGLTLLNSLDREHRACRPRPRLHRRLRLRPAAAGCASA